MTNPLRSRKKVKKKKLIINATPTRTQRRAFTKENRKFIMKEMQALKEKWRLMIKMIPEPDKYPDTIEYLNERIDEIRQACSPTSGLNDEEFKGAFLAYQDIHTGFVSKVVDAKKQQISGTSLIDKVKKVFSKKDRDLLDD